MLLLEWYVSIAKSNYFLPYSVWKGGGMCPFEKVFLSTLKLHHVTKRALIYVGFKLNAHY